jgi:hypothetical protein
MTVHHRGSLIPIFSLTHPAPVTSIIHALSSPRVFHLRLHRQSIATAHSSFISIGGLQSASRSLLSQGQGGQSMLTEQGVQHVHVQAQVPTASSSFCASFASRH